jgi:hypothetical protein
MAWRPSFSAASWNACGYQATTERISPLPKKKTQEDPKEQLQDFKRLAEKIGADGEKDANEVMRRLAKQRRGNSREVPQSRSK